MIDESMVSRIAELAQEATEIRTTKIGERTYSNENLVEVKEPPLPEPAALRVHTLTGLVDYLAANRDELPLDKLVLHVVGPGRVDLVSETKGLYHQRFTHAQAINYNRFEAFRSFQFNAFMDTEALIIALQALFEATHDRATVMRLIGNLQNEEVTTKVDDGVTQRATVKSGIAVVEKQNIPNPFTLAPFRTFPDVDAQPASEFVLRIRKSGDEMKAALFEADGGAWQNEAINSVASWLSTRLAQVEVAVAVIA